MSGSQAILNSAGVSPEVSPINLFLMTDSFQTGGSERQFAVIAQHVPPEHFRVSLGCLKKAGPFAASFNHATEFSPGGSLFGFSSIRARVQLGRLLRRKKIDVAHAFDFYTNLMMIPAARLAGVPVVIGSQRQLGDLLSARQFRAQMAVFRWCDAVVCNSKAAADRLAAGGLSRERLFIIGNALPEEIFQQVPPSVERQPGRLRVGMVARMNARYKGHAAFLRIAARVHERIPEIEFLLAGDGPLRPTFEQQAQELGLSKNVKFLGDRRDIPGILASMDVAVLASDSESLSNVLLEAMAAALPVVAYNVGGNAELVKEDRGMLISAGDECQFAESIVQLLAGADMRVRLGQQGRKFVLENFSLKHVLAQYEACYEILLQKKGIGNSRAQWGQTSQIPRNS